MTTQPTSSIVLMRRTEILQQLGRILSPGQNVASQIARFGDIIGKDGSIFYRLKRGQARLKEEDIECLRQALIAERDKADTSEILRPLIDELLQEREDQLDLRCLGIDIKVKALGGDDEEGDLEEGDPTSRPLDVNIVIGEEISFRLRRNQSLRVTLTHDGKLVFKKS